MPGFVTDGGGSRERGGEFDTAVSAADLLFSPSPNVSPKGDTVY